MCVGRGLCTPAPCCDYELYKHTLAMFIHTLSPFRALGNVIECQSCVQCIAAIMWPNWLITQRHHTRFPGISLNQSGSSSAVYYIIVSDHNLVYPAPISLTPVCGRVKRSKPLLVFNCHDYSRLAKELFNNRANA